MKIKIAVILLFICTVLYAENIFYMNVKLKDKRIGWYEYSKKIEKGVTTIGEKARMVMNVYDKNVQIDAYSMAVYDSLSVLKKMFVSVQNQFFSLYVNGYVKEGNLIISTISGEETFYDTVDIKNKNIIFNAESVQENMVGRKDLFMFNPLSRKLEGIFIEKAGKEDIYISGKKVNAEKMRITGESMNELVYFGEDGILMTISLNEGVVMERTDTLENKFDETELINMFSVEAEGDFSNIRDAETASFIIESASKDSFKEYRQSQNGDTLTVSRKVFYVPEELSVSDTTYISSGKKIKDVAKEIIKKAGADKERQIYLAMNFVNKNLKQEIFPGLILPEEILENGKGDCTEHAQLYASLVRSMGLKCDIVSGLVYMDGAFYYHAWNRVLWSGRIYTVDATFNQKDADVSHIMLSSGFPPSRVLLNSIAEKVKIIRIK